MRRAILWAATGLLILSAAILPTRSLMAQNRFPEPDQLPSHPELPDPLVMFNGERVAGKQQWIDKRRPELKALFQRYWTDVLWLSPQITGNTALATICIFAQQQY